MKVLFVILSAISITISLALRTSTEHLWLVFKGIASAFFVAAGLTSFLQAKEKCKRFLVYGGLILLGLIFSFFADIFIDISFMPGLVLFCMTQTIYFVAFFCFGKPTRNIYLLTAAIFIPLLIMELTLPIIDFGDLLIPVIFYLLLITLMTGKSYSGFALPNPCAKTMAIGATLFLISDVVLQFKFFSEIGSEHSLAIDIANSILYYGAQLVIACSLSSDVFCENSCEKMQTATN